MCITLIEILFFSTKLHANDFFSFFYLKNFVDVERDISSIKVFSKGQKTPKKKEKPWHLHILLIRKQIRSPHVWT